MKRQERILYALLVFVPVSIWLGLTHASPTAVFVVSCLAILPLAGLMGEATEHLTHHTGPGIGGLLNATFGNAAELIIAFMALRAGETEIVKASLTGSIIGNMLMVLGLAMLLGGWKHKELRFNRLAAESGSSMMVLAVVALVIPAIYAPGHPPQGARAHRVDQPRHLLHPDPHLRRRASSSRSRPTSASSRPEAASADSRRPWRDGPGRSRRSCAGAARRRRPAWVRERVPGPRGGRGRHRRWAWARSSWASWWWRWSATPPSTRPRSLVAMKNKMDLALGIAMGSSMQIALFVAPVLVIAGHVIGQPLGLEFTILEVVAVMLSVRAVALLVHDGKTNWFEGVQLLAIYAILAIAFYFV